MKIVYRNVRGYLAMNHEAAKQLHLSKHSSPPSGTVYMNKSFEGKRHTKRFIKTLGHERFELHNLKDRKMKYKKQESYTNKFERNM